MKISRITVVVSAVAIVAVLALGLVLGLGFVQRVGKTVTTVSYVLENQTLYVTQTQPVTQSILSTVSLLGINHTVTTTQTSVSLSQTTTIFSTTRNLTIVENQTSFKTTTETLTTTDSPGSAAIVLMPQGFQIIFKGQRSIFVTGAQITPGFNGFLAISWKTTNTTNVHWVLQGNAINETSFSSPQGGVEFPVQAGIPYALTVFDDACTPFSCTNSFNVTATIIYQY